MHVTVEKEGTDVVDRMHGAPTKDDSYNHLVDYIKIVSAKIV